MVQFWDSIPDHLAEWALAQPLFFTASAPLTGSHINTSPKGLPSATFTIFSPNSAAYIDATGSGCETASHIHENGRVTIMFCSFETSPRILRFFCWGEVVEWNDKARFGEMVRKMGKTKVVEGARAVVRLKVWKRLRGRKRKDVYDDKNEQVQTSCGFGVPYLSPPTHDDIKAIERGEKVSLGLKDRATMGHWASKQIEKNALRDYQKKMNAYSLDGLPGFRAALRDSGKSVWWAKVGALFRRIGAQKEAFGVGMM
ncbi:MAG: hypothetical protein Q9182_001606, partial [Xanthomendoza sp. 2 TL-2023]